MRISKYLFLTVSFLLFILLFKYVLEKQKYNNQIIKVDIILKNNCELIDSAFMVSTFPKEKNAFFENKKATMYLKRSSKVQLQASNKYEGFHYSSIPVKVQKNLILEANCTEEGRLEEIFDSLNKQFKEKE